MNKSLFLVFHGFTSYNGISKKISYQIDAFNRCGTDMELCYYDVTPAGERVWKINDRPILSFGYGIMAKLKKRFCYGALSRSIIKENIDFIYIRSLHNANPSTIRMARKLKKAGIVTLLEIPTYPYDSEYIGAPLSMRFNLFIDKCFRHSFARLFYRIVTFSDADFIFGCPTIKISNGIDFDKINVKTVINDISCELHLIGVAEIHFWHGFDRAVKGLAEYYKTYPEYKVYFHIVGKFAEKKEEDDVTMPIIQNHIEQYVIFHGTMQGEELDNLFNRCDFGIGSLGRHRSGITKIKTLKNREYAARGIPFIYSETDDDFEKMPYIMKAAADETPVDIPSVISFYKNMKMTPFQIRNSIQSLSWKEQTQKIINEIQQ